MYRPTTRVLAALELLQTHQRIGGAALAERLGVDRRTVRRYIAQLEELGIPIQAERGRDGGYRLIAGFKLPPMMFTDDEALALSLGLAAARSLGLADAAPAVASAQAKLERVLPASVKRRVRALDDTVSLDLTRGVAPEDNAALATLTAAAAAQQTVHLRYRSAERDESRRDFDPYGLAWRGGRWYAVGHCHLRLGLRSFRLDRMVSVEPVPRSFARPAAFDALEHLRISLATLPRAFSIRVLLHTSLQRAQQLLFPAMGLFEETGDGVLLHAEADELDWFARELARLPFGITILDPPELGVALAAHARQLLARLASEHA